MNEAVRESMRKTADSRNGRSNEKPGQGPGIVSSVRCGKSVQSLYFSLTSEILS